LKANAMQTMALPSISPASRSPLRPLPRTLDLALSRTLSAVGTQGGNLMRGDMPDDVRQALATRHALLAEALAPADKNQIRAVLATLADMPATSESDPWKARFALERDILDLRGLPEQALASAARAYRRGEVGDGRWRPTAGQLARLAREKCATATRELQRISRVLNAPVQAEALAAPERRRAVLAMMHSLAVQLSEPDGVSLASTSGRPAPQKTP
jgi:hypothetical protein